VEGAHRRHEVATALSALLDRGLLTPDDLLPVIDAREAEAEPGFATLDAWRSWLLAGDGGIAVAAGRLLRAPDDEGLRPIGAASGAVRVIRWRRELARRGRCLLPEDLLRDAGRSPHDAVADPDSAEVTSVVRLLAEEARAFLAAAKTDSVPRAAIATVLPAVLARRDLRQAPDIPTTPRGLADRLAVTWAALSGRIP
jgi:phytoene synthase